MKTQREQLWCLCYAHPEDYRLVAGAKDQWDGGIDDEGGDEVLDLTRLAAEDWAHARTLAWNICAVHNGHVLKTASDKALHRAINAGYPIVKHVRARLERRDPRVITIRWAALRDWEDDTLLGLFERFVVERGLLDTLIKFLQRVAREEDRLEKEMEDA